jgi:2-polyprenyl-3-methyl-5-hydroxy-6-metoxy-1,4-benzoquinol methylase
MSLRMLAKRTLTSLVPPSMIAPLLPFSSPRLDAAAWDDEYATEQWARLHTIEELSRYSLIVGYCAFLRQGGSVLEVGCGEGVLARRVLSAGVARYLGIDLSAQAIAAAQAAEIAGCDFVAADAETYQPPPGQQFDVLIFNESLYYFKQPGREVSRYSECLTPDGIVIVSLQNVVRSHQIWSMLRRGFKTLDAVRVAHGRLSWDVRVLQRSSAPTR